MARFIGNISRPSRGEIWWLPTKVAVADGKPVLERKPWLVVHGNQWAQDVRWLEILVVRVTSDVTKVRPTQIPLSRTEPFQGVVLCETLTAAPRWRFHRYAASVTPGTMAKVEAALLAVLGIGES
ncbi:MAG: type II toxin-antitoxin system PemK/MazF family toxin [Acidimicrobiia bacterium]